MRKPDSSFGAVHATRVPTYGATFLGDNNIMSWSADGYVRLWRARSRIDAKCERLLKEGYPIMSVAVSADKTALAAFGWHVVCFRDNVLVSCRSAFIIVEIFNLYKHNLK